MNTTASYASYKHALVYSIEKEESKESKKLVVETINNSTSRKTREDDEWPTWVFSEKGCQMQSTNCILCGNYIEIGWKCKNDDPERKIKYIYCNDLKHQHTTNKLVNLIWVKQLLKLYYVEKRNHFLYYAALECVLYLKPELDTFAYAFREYIGIPHNVW
jgi:hypothetical protein